MASHDNCVGARRNSLASKTWLAERKEILQKIKDQVRLYLGDEPKDVTLYAGAYKADISRAWAPSNLNEVVCAIDKVRVVLGGDFHPFAQAQRAHLRLMRNISATRSVILAVECLFEADQPIVDRFMSSEISEQDFLDQVRWDECWGFPWKHYRPLFEYAKTRGIKVLALNVEVDERSAETLSLRDQAAASIVGQSLDDQPESLVYILYGDLHIAENNLHASILKQTSLDKEEIASVYLNSESIYFELAERGQEGQVDVVRFNETQFCVLSSPPWVKWQSYLMYLEENFDIDLDADEDEWEFQVDHTDHVSSLVLMICADLELELKTDAIEVYSLEDPQVLKVTEKVLTTNEHELAKRMVQADKSFYIPREGFFYLSKATVNHAATLAGQYVQARLSKRSRMLWSFPEDFLPLIWIEAMGFLLSKFVNPKRKAQTMNDLKKQLQAFDNEDRGREPLLLALDQKMSELLSTYANKGRDQSFVPREKSSYGHAARFIGEIMGERYFLLYQKQIIDKDRIRELLRQDLEEKSFDAFYFEQLKSLDQLES